MPPTTSRREDRLPGSPSQRTGAGPADRPQAGIRSPGTARDRSAEGPGDGQPDVARPPLGVLVLLAYGLAMLVVLALTLPLVVEEAVLAPISPLGLLWMLLLAYLIFTLTLIIQRKQAAWGLSLGLATLSLPLTLVLFAWAQVPGALAGVLVALLLFLSLRRKSVRAWFSER